ncbi:hypothetical protein ACOZHU_24240, partial [Klebsiella pneumoniae]
KSAQIREILISESAWEEMTCLFAPSLCICVKPWQVNHHFSKYRRRYFAAWFLFLSTIAVYNKRLNN